jgi:hypothetical protein
MHFWKEKTRNLLLFSNLCKKANIYIPFIQRKKISNLFLLILEYRVPMAIPFVLPVTLRSRFNEYLWLLRWFDEMPDIDEEPPKVEKPVKLLAVNDMNKHYMWTLQL